MLILSGLLSCAEEPGSNVATKIPAPKTENGQNMTNTQTPESFLAENAKKDGVITTASGLQYEVITSGTGKTPGPADTVAAHYAGTLLDGSEFDNSYKRGAPLTIPVGGVIPGWTEALLKMKEGDKWKLYIPPALGYGARGAGPIPPNSLLIFEVELVEVK